MKPMLAQTADDIKLDAVLTNNTWAAQQKFDGHRLLVEIVNGKVTGYNRKGTVVHDFNFPNPKAFKARWVFDCERIGDLIVVFDIPVAANAITPNTPAGVRLDFMEKLAHRFDPPNFYIADTYYGTEDKQKLFKTLKEENAEGLIFKNLNGAYEFGKRPATMLKYKFTETADVVVMELERENKRQAVTIGLHHDGKLIEVAGCKIPEEAVGVVREGDVIEVKYLYATEDHKLYQPVWVRLRTDKDQSECTTVGLKHTNRNPIEIQ